MSESPPAEVLRAKDSYFSINPNGSNKKHPLRGEVLLLSHGLYPTVVCCGLEAESFDITISLACRRLSSRPWKRCSGCTRLPRSSAPSRALVPSLHALLPTTEQARPRLTSRCPRGPNTERPRCLPTAAAAHRHPPRVEVTLHNGQYCSRKHRKERFEIQS